MNSNTWSGAAGPPADTPVGPAARPAMSAGLVMLRILTVIAVLTSATAVVTMAVAVPVAAHGIDANGCTGVPDSGYGFDFHSACDRHDGCYRTKPYGASSADRRRCDRVFRADMLDHCGRNESLTAAWLSCRTVAGAYYLGVRALGRPFWSNGESTPIA